MFEPDKHKVKKRTEQTRYFKDDIEYIFQIKRKLEGMLDDMITYYGLSECISSKKLYRVDYNKFKNLKKFRLFWEQKRDFTGKMIPFEDRQFTENFNDWFEFNFKDYVTACDIYENIIQKKSVEKEELLTLNRIYNKLFK